MRRLRHLSVALASLVVVGAWSTVVAPASHAQTPASAAATVAPAGLAPVEIPGGFVAVTPQRLADTRIDTGALGPVNMGRSINVMAGPVPGFPPSSVGAAVVNITVTRTHASGYLTAYPANTTRPAASNLNFSKGQTVANLATVRLQDGKFTIYNGSSGAVDIVVDVFGYYLGGVATDPGTFTPLAPARVLDTRIGQGAAKSPVKGKGTLAVKVGGQAGVPASGVSAVVLNLTATRAHTTGYITAWPYGSARPTASNLNFAAGTSIPNMITAQVSADGRLDLYNGSSQPVDLIADVAGYYLAGTATQAGAFVPVLPTRFLDTRIVQGVRSGPLASRGTASVQVEYTGGTGATHIGGVPASNVSAVVTNVTATSEAKGGYLSVAPLQDDPELDTSNLNYAASTTRANAAVVKVGTCGQLSFYNGGSGATQVVGDVSGYFLALDADPDPAPASTVDAWGGGAAGSLGSGAFGTAVAPEPTMETSDIVSIAANQQVLALDSDGVVSTWGSDSSGMLGIGEDTSADQGLGGCAIPVPNVVGGIAVAAGATSSYALDSDGTVWSWGDNSSGQLGDGTTTSELSRAKSPDLSDVTAIAAGPTFALALKSDGTVWGWGRESYGELGNGASTITTPTQIASTTLTGITAIAAGAHTGYALTSDGHVLAWGANLAGQLGNGSAPDTDPHPNPAAVTGLTGVSKIAAGPGQTVLALLSDGTVASWGSNDHGQLGDGNNSLTQAWSSSPVAVQAVSAVTELAVGLQSATALESDGTVWTWGAHPADASSVDLSTPEAVTGLTGVTGIAQGLSTGFAIVP